MDGCNLESDHRVQRRLPGCANCYAMKLAGGRLAHHPSRKGLTQPSKAGPVWNGQVRYNREWLDQPLRWRKPREDGDRVSDAVRSGPWPLPNIWLGTSVEDQDRANERIPPLLQTPAAVRFLSAEPLLGEVEIFNMDGPIDVPDGMPSPLHWVIVGGESGPGARPMHPDWARSIRDQCEAVGVPFFFKQWGAWRPADIRWPGGERCIMGRNGHVRSQGSESFYDNDWIMLCAGKAAAGRELDGRTWDQMPT